MTLAARALLVSAMATALGGVALQRYGLTHRLTFVPSEMPLVAPTVPDLPPSRPLVRSLTVLLLDGLRVDAAEASQAWTRLAPRGARLRVRTPFPVKSASSRSLLITGAPPEVTGVIGNVPSPLGEVDHLLRRASRAGIEVVNQDDWPAWLGISRIDRAPAARRLTLLDRYACDDAGHAEGAGSPRYAEAVAAGASEALAIAAATDLERDALLLLSDHGHVDGGGHAGLEPEVAIAPTLLLGAGVRAGFAQDGPAPMEDLGATLAVLLGLSPPARSRGVPLVDALDLDPPAARALRAAFEERRAAVLAAEATAARPARVWTLRALCGLAALAGLLALTGRPDSQALACAAIGPLLFAGLEAALGPPMSLEWRRAIPAHAALALGALAASSLVALNRRTPFHAAARSTLLAWGALPALLLARCGFGPSGMPPTPWAFWLASSALGLAGIALLVALVAAARGSPRGPIRP